jgi:hypothetical protein
VSTSKHPDLKKDTISDNFDMIFVYTSFKAIYHTLSIISIIPKKQLLQDSKEMRKNEGGHI